jgi:hypothetical protein
MTRATLDAIVNSIADGIRILRTRDGVPVSDAQCIERARNVALALVTDFDFEHVVLQSGDVA